VARGWGRDFPRCCKTIDNGLKAGKMHPRQAPEAVNDNTKLVDITRMLDNARAKVEGGEGNPEELVTTVQIDPEKLPPIEEEVTEQPILAATPFQWKDPSTLPRREFAFGRHFIRKYVSVTVAPGGLGKTANSIVEALAMAS